MIKSLFRAPMAINTRIFKHNLIVCSNIVVRKGEKFLFIRRSNKKKVAPGFVHFIGGKVKLNEDPLIAAKRELMEEAGVTAENVKLEAVITEVFPPSSPDFGGTWLVFNFSGELVSGTPKATEEGDLLWLTAEEVAKEKLIVSVAKTIRYILDPGKGTIFARFRYNSKGEIKDSEINFCKI